MSTIILRLRIDQGHKHFVYWACYIRDKTMVSFLKVNLDTNFVFDLLLISLDCRDCSSNFSESFPKKETALFLLLASSNWVATVVGRRDFSMWRWIWASCLQHYREYRLWNQECSFLNMIGAKTQRQKDFKACRPFQIYQSALGIPNQSRSQSPSVFWSAPRHRALK